MTTNYLITDADMVTSPSFRLTNSGAGYYYFNKMTDWEVARVFTGTACIARLYVGSGTTLEISFDAGSSWSDVTVGTNNAFTDITLWTGLSDTAHSFRLRQKSGLTNTVLFNTSSSGAYTFQVTGAAPASAKPTGYGTQYDPQSTPFTTYGKTDGDWNASADPYYTASNWPSDGQRFNFDGSTIRVVAYGSGNKIGLMIDGVDDSVVTLPNDGHTYRRTIKTGLTGSHEYRLVNAGGSFNLTGIELEGGSGLVTTAVANTATIGFMGDSITSGYGASDATKSWPHLLAASRGKIVLNRGYPGATGHDDGTSTDTTGRFSGERSTHIARLTSYSPKPKEVYWAYGVNDRANGAVSQAAWIATVTHALNELIAGLDIDATITVIGMWPLPDALYPAVDTVAERAAINTDTLNAIAACDAPSRVTFYNPDDASRTYLGTAAQTSDNVHPNNTGNTLIYNDILATGTTPPTVARRRAGSGRTGTRTAIYG